MRLLAVQSTALSMILVLTPTDFDGQTVDRSMTVSANRDNEAAIQSSSTSRKEKVQTTYSISESACADAAPTVLECYGPGNTYIPTCAGGAVTVPYYQRVYSTATHELLSTTLIYQPCNTEVPEQSAPIITVSEHDFRQLPLAAPALTIQPAATSTLYVNLPVYMHSSSDSQILTTTILDTPVTIRATPIEYTWDYGDSESHTKTSPGQPYPDTTNAHTYSVPGTYITTLTTQWAGEFTIDNGQTWTPIDGTASTTTASPALNITESIPLLTKTDG
jgi:hypothetical protein